MSSQIYIKTKKVANFKNCSSNVSNVAIFAEEYFLRCKCLNLFSNESIVRKLHCLNNYWAKQGIPGPKRNLIFGNLLQLMNGFKTFDIENTKKYGKNFGYVVFVAFF